MKHGILQTLSGCIVAVSCMFNGFAATAVPSPESVKALTQKVADWQIETFDEHGKYRALPEKKTWQNHHNYHDLTWQMGALYAGMNQWRKLSGDANVTDFMMKIGDRNGWTLHKRPYHADDHTVGQFYLSLYEETHDPKMIGPTRERFDWILANPKTGSLTWGNDTDCHNRWGWCDALFMAPPVWARLAKVTGDSNYLEFMDQEYHATYDLLWDQDDHLFWRDSSYFSRREKNGGKLYWSRGNGWVFGGLALMIPDLPQNWEGRAFYVDLFKQMAVSIKSCQREDGTWSMGLLGGVEGYPIKETSGTSFFTFGLAWGINNGLLDRAEYEPVVLSAWNALTECVTDEGLLGYVQPVGAAPGDSYADKTEVYGVGAFLAAGTEVYRLVGNSTPSVPSLTTFMKDSGWCWYQDPRAILYQNKVIIGGVEGNGSGAAVVGVYDLQKKQILGSTVFNENFDRDDHNCPVFWARPDGRLLAVYARHGTDSIHRYRFSTSTDFLEWDPEKCFEHTHETTYMNLYEMKSEGKLYNFYRGFDWNPSFITSTDGGKTWGEETHFFKNEVGGRHRPYARYAGNGEDTVSVSITDAHPRDYGNSLYYFEFRGGNFYKADGTLIKALKDGPLMPSEAELVYQGSNTGVKPAGCESVPDSAWTSSIAIDTNGYPHIGYTLYLADTDHRYRIASWDGSTWTDREVAFAGKCLYQRESSYTGLITLDPVDPSVVFISTDVDPSTGEALGGLHEIYRAKIGLDDNRSDIQWEAVTQNSKVRNIRPVVLRDGARRVILWNRGRFTTYTDYDLNTVGFEEQVKER